VHVQKSTPLREVRRERRPEPRTFFYNMHNLRGQSGHELGRRCAAQHHNSQQVHHRIGIVRLDYVVFEHTPHSGFLVRRIRDVCASMLEEVRASRQLALHTRTKQGGVPINAPLVHTRTIL
jgi:hypothetical protein